MTAALLAGAVVTLAACSAPAPAPSPAAATPAGPDAVEVAVPDVAVTVSNPGADPRRLLTLQAAPNAGQQVTLSTSSTITQTVGTNPPADRTTPPVELPLTATALEPAQTPTHTLKLTYGTPRSPDATLAAALAKATGSTSTLVAGPDGAVKKLGLDPPADLSDAGRSAVEQSLRQAVQFAPVLPPSPVGVGAVWKVSQQINSLGLELRQDTVFTLTAIRGESLDLAMRVSQTPLSPSWQLPNDQGTLNVDSYVAAGEGTLTLDLTKPLPVNGGIQLAGDQVFSQPGDNLKLTQHLTNGVAWKS